MYIYSPPTVWLLPGFWVALLYAAVGAERVRRGGECRGPEPVARDGKAEEGDEAERGTAAKSGRTRVPGPEPSVARPAATSSLARW